MEYRLCFIKHHVLQAGAFFSLSPVMQATLSDVSNQGLKKGLGNIAMSLSKLQASQGSVIL